MFLHELLMSLHRSYYSSSISQFLDSSGENVMGILAMNGGFSLEIPQRDAWQREISIMQSILQGFNGSIYLEYSIPRMGRRIDVLLLIGPVIFVLEFKVGEKDFKASARDQVWDYALDLKNFHETSHKQMIAPILIATQASSGYPVISTTPQNDQLLFPISCSPGQLRSVLKEVLCFADGVDIVKEDWEGGRYCPTPTIIEAAMALFKGHSVSEISRNDALAENLSKTCDAVASIIRLSRALSYKSICFVTGVPGAGKTLVGLKIATSHIDKSNNLHSIFLSGNGPLVSILTEALVRDRVQQERQKGRKINKGTALEAVKSFIQNVHHFRDECLVDELRPPIEHVALFDEAQRAWNLEQTSGFMKRKKNRPDFSQSEPEFLISCLDRHPDWAVIVCLVGGGQEINTGEAGISEWIESLNRSFRDWKIFISPQLSDSEYGAQDLLANLCAGLNVQYYPELHLAVSMRSFRAEHVSLLVKQMLDLDIKAAHETLEIINIKYPIVITRDLDKAKKWVKAQARGSERYGIVVSSQAERLKPHAIDVKSPMNPIHWFLDGKDDVRSSYYLEDVATEFDIQGLELDWVCVTWDADFRYKPSGWDHRSFVGSKWHNINKPERKIYLKNAYRVLLTRARQGMVIVVPPGDPEDPTRMPEFYNPTYEYLKSIGFPIL